MLRRWKHSLSRHVPLEALLHPRRFHAYCIGSAKSGTHSVAGIFERDYRAAHEPEYAEHIGLIMDARTGEKDSAAIRRSILRRDRMLNLEMEASQLNFFLLDELLTIFPKAKFILTIRDCYSWLDSVLNNHRTRDIPEPWDQIIALRHGSPDFRHSPRARVLDENGFYPLEGYLSYWAYHNRTVLHRVPPGRLLVVRTDRIGSELGRIANFVGVHHSSLDGRRAHLFRAPAAFGFVQQIHPGFLEETVDRFGRDIMQRYFPEIRSAADALGASSGSKII